MVLIDFGFVTALPENDGKGFPTAKMRRSILSWSDRDDWAYSVEPNQWADVLKAAFSVEDLTLAKYLGNKSYQAISIRRDSTKHGFPSKRLLNRVERLVKKGDVRSLVEFLFKASWFHDMLKRKPDPSFDYTKESVGCENSRRQ